MSLLAFALVINSYTSELADEAFKHDISAYLAEPIHIYSVTSEITIMDSVLSDDTLDDLLLKVQQNEKATNDIYFIFQVNEVIAGDPETTITLKFPRKEIFFDSCPLNEDFNLHTNPVFWKYSDGRSQPNKYPLGHYNKTCFEIGKEYLLLNRNLFKRKAFELIRSPNDHWYQYIKSKFKEKY